MVGEEDAAKTADEMEKRLSQSEAEPEERGQPWTPTPGRVVSGIIAAHRTKVIDGKNRELIEVRTFPQPPETRGDLWTVWSSAVLETKLFRHIRAGCVKIGDKTIEIKIGSTPVGIKCLGEVKRPGKRPYNDFKVMIKGYEV